MSDQTAPIDERYYQLLEELQALDFVLVELNLFLDTHKGDAQALQQYNHFSELRRKVACEIEASYGPLMHFGHSLSNFPWQWTDTPWPWQV